MKKFISLMMCMVLSMSMLCSQTIQISGHVTDESSTPLSGVSVLVKGGKTATITDVNGNYTITAKPSATLVFSFLGMKSREVAVNNRTTIDVVMESEVTILEDVVIVAYRTQSKQVFTGAVSLVSAEYSHSPTPAYAMVADYNTEEYESVQDNRFKLVRDEPLSTFSADVDCAAYGNMRRFINQGQMPPKDAIRVEELVNYFSYNYPKPKNGRPVSITAEVSACPWNEQHRLVRIGLKAKEIADEKLPASNLVFLIDVSGSMYGPTRLDLVKASLKLLVNNLRDKDRVAIVVYAGSAGEVLPSTSGSDKQKIKEALDKLTAGGSTAGGAGIQLAYKIAKKNFIEKGNNRVILCTDGDFNVGVSNEKELENLIEQERKSGIFLTVLGYGMGNYKDKKLQVLAQKGNGNHAYIDNLQEANKVLVEEFGGTMYTVAKDVKLQVEFNPTKVQAYRLVGYETRLLNKEDFNDDTKDAGEMGAGHTVTALYEVAPIGVQGSFGSVDDLKYQKTEAPKTILNFSPELLTVKVRYKNPNEDTSQRIEVPLVDNNSAKASDDFRFAAAVAMFGQLLRDSDYKGNASYKKVITLAESGLGNDKLGYRHEFVRLVKTAEGMAK
ncbi:MAG: von Willebrand factor type A domain-containing protein [Bacteroidales bacterium]|nr:von Willebrand factor type A domain-containing protein [Bacteroidales bacterium]